MNDFINKVLSQYDDVLNYIVGHSDFDLIIKYESATDSHFHF